MNLLAHAAFLPYGDPLRMTAAVVGDRIRGPLDSGENLLLHPSVVEGVRLHRSLDTLSENHPALQEARAIFPESNRRFAGIALDLLGDWVLWRHWRAFHPEQQWDFVRQCEKGLSSSRLQLPPNATDWANRILSLHLLTACTSPQGIRTACRRLSGRLTQPDGLQSACETALRGISQIEPKMLDFFASAKQFLVHSA
ncbi:MAG TPA: ACP phosphodiesterase [Fibrobacteraceae bacterium]|nr:ACP phosphodiesterase [Fibrobacteraceae bacterium]